MVTVVKIILTYVYHSRKPKNYIDIDNNKIDHTDIEEAFLEIPAKLQRAKIQLNCINDARTYIKHAYHQTIIILLYLVVLTK